MTGFGLSLERPTMIKYKIDNIREGMEISQTLYDIVALECKKTSRKCRKIWIFTENDFFFFCRFTAANDFLKFYLENMTTKMYRYLFPLIYERYVHSWDL